ncbi:MAG: POTRA domain-containing protein, partial [Thermoanaerobaculia bacterium]|nr:POTRA domain-containing protein [Thermoanaerobaculia bacterium]
MKRPHQTLTQLCLAALVSVGIVTGASAQIDHPEGTITSIEFESDTEYDLSNLQDIVMVSEGMELALVPVQQSIKKLFDTGDFRDIRVEATQTPDGIILTFSLSINYRIGSIEFEGLDLNRERARNELQFEPEQVLSLNAVDRSAEAVQRMLVRRGFLEATVDPEVRFFRQANRADVILHVERGPQAKIGSIEFEGELAPFSRDKLLEKMKIGVGDDYRRSEARRAAERVTRFLVQEDYRTSSVRFLEESYDPETTRAALLFEAEIGPIVEVVTTEEVSRGVRRLLPFADDQPYAPDVIDRARDRIIDYYQRRGFFFAEASVAETRSEGTLSIEFSISPGEAYELGEVRFEGAEQVSSDTLREVIQAGESGAFQKALATILRRPQGVTSEILSDDREALESYYRLHGFTEARVARPVPRPNDDGTFDIIFQIFEGTQTIVSNVEVEGVEQ